MRCPRTEHQPCQRTSSVRPRIVPSFGSGSANGVSCARIRAVAGPVRAIQRPALPRAAVACPLHVRCYMNIDITTEHVAMRPEWHDIIDAWLNGCRRRHPDVQGLDVTLRHADFEPMCEAVDLVALARGRSLHARTSATDM